MGLGNLRVVAERWRIAIELPNLENETCSQDNI